tara:strand:- start:4284 stop:4901 length:618 start_codon:yes stop_codon:yes gene_type:complete
MRKRFYLLSLICFSFFLNAQQVTFEEYDLDNGLHVILHQDNTAPVVVTSVLYHVGAKNEEDERTGMTIEVESQKTNQQQALTEMKMMGNILQKQVVNKDYAYMEMQGQKMDMEGEMLKQMLTEAAIFPELNLDLDALELVGVTEIDGKKAYEIKITEGILNYYDIENYLKIQVSQTMEIMGNSQTNVIKMNDYKNADGIFFHTRL